MLKVKYKSVKTEVPDDTYISKIESVIGKVKNVTFEVSLEDMKIYELEDVMFVIMNIKDNTGVMSALIVSNNDNETKEVINTISNNLKSKYLISGMTATNVDFMREQLNELTENNDIFKKDMFKDKMLLVRAIQRNEV